MIKSVGDLRGPVVRSSGSVPGAAALPGVYGIVLAGVHAWGGCVLDEVICRPLVPIAARPLVCHALEWLRGQGIPAASLCANSDTQGLRGYLGSGSGLGLALEYYEDVMPRGPAGCVRDAGAGRQAKWLVVVYGTIVPQIALADVLRAHEASRALLTIVAAQGGPGRSCDGKALEPAGAAPVGGFVELANANAADAVADADLKGQAAR